MNTLKTSVTDVFYTDMLLRLFGEIYQIKLVTESQFDLFSVPLSIRTLSCFNGRGLCKLVHFGVICEVLFFLMKIKFRIEEKFICVCMCSKL